jgi:hypothetical protein
MKVVGVEFGRVSLLVDLVDLGTRAGIYLPDAALIVQQRYSFVHVPTVAPASQTQQMYRFEQGKFSKGGKNYSVSAFEVHPHGLVVQGTDTDAAETFLDDFFELGIEHLGMKTPTRPATKVYASAVVVEFGKDFNQIVKKWNDVTALFSSQLKQTYGIAQQVQIASINLKPDPNSMPPRLGVLLSDFVLEHRIHAPFEQQRFYALAPLRTDDHISLLKSFEKIAL